jgi:hypothetical protein
MHDADAVPAASPPRQVGHAVVIFAVRSLNGWLAAEMEITVPKVAEWPAAGLRAKRADLFDDGGGQAGVDEGRLSWTARRDGLFFRRRRDAQRSERLSFGAAVGPSGDGGLFDLSDRNRPSG